MKTKNAIEIENTLGGADPTIGLCRALAEACDILDQVRDASRGVRWLTAPAGQRAEEFFAQYPWLLKE